MNLRLPVLLGIWIAVLVCGGCATPAVGPAAEFLRFLLSREGQQIIAADGSIPLNAATLNEGRRSLAE